MHAKLVRYSVPPETLPDPPEWPGDHPAWGHPNVSVVDPTWTEVEAAVRRLDARRFCWLHLWPTTDERVIDVNPGTSEFVGVYGGGGAYVCHISFADGRDANLHFPGQPRRKRVVLPDPWGFADGAYSEAAFRVCRDVELVVRAVRYYCDMGGLDPSLAWDVLRDNAIFINRPPKPAEPSAAPDPAT
jgi:hypothetical protein